MNQRLQVSKYVFSDWLSAAVTWVIFYTFRKNYVEPKAFGMELHWQADFNFFIGLLVIPLFWVLLYASTGSYKNIYRRHRVRELGQTMLNTVIGVVILFFLLLLDDVILHYEDYYSSVLVLFTTQFLTTFTGRFILTSRTVKRVHRREIGFDTIIIGGNVLAVQCYHEMKEMYPSPGFKFVGYVSVNGQDKMLGQELPWLGKFEAIEKVIKEHNIQEVIIAIESSEHKNLGNIITKLEGLDVIIKIIPDMYDILSGSVKMTSIFGAPLIEVNTQIMPSWQFTIKRLLDFTVSIAALIILAPVFLVLAILVKMSSKGPVIFKQERIGQYNKPFYIYKFRSMYMDAEKDGPQLSSAADHRITPIGRFLRKTRFDELPQFINVLKGDMSLVGPRPERQHFIDLIIEKAPHYRHLQKVKPGITSWGQVKYGYAENVDQMIQRLKFDVLYIENMSLAIDFKILAYTIITILKGSGK